MQSAQASRNVFDALTGEGRIFRNRGVLSSDYVPEDFPHRNDEIDQVAHILRPALEGSRPSNILIYGQTGTGKTAVARYICDQLKDKVTANGGAIHTAHINCKRVNTPYGILANIGQTYTTNWEDSIPHTGWRLEQVYAALCRKAEEAGGIALVVLDEVDALVKKSGDEVLYHLTGINADLGNARMSLIGISNDTKFTTFLDPRVKSRLGEESLTFPPYNALQLRDILDQRAGQAFHEGALDPQVLSLCAGRAAQEHGDARKALDLLRIAAEMAERDGLRQVTVDYVNRAESMMEQDQVRKMVLQLPLQHKAVLASIIANESQSRLDRQTTGDVYDTYYRICNRFELDALTQRRIGGIISELDMQGVISARVASLGRHGRTRFISTAVPFSELQPIISDDSFMSSALDLAADGHFAQPQLRLM